METSVIIIIIIIIFCVFCASSVIVAGGLYITQITTSTPIPDSIPDSTVSIPDSIPDSTPSTPVSIPYSTPSTPASISYSTPSTPASIPYSTPPTSPTVLVNDTSYNCSDNSGVYRYINDKLYHYPNPTIAASWDTNWSKAKTIDCSTTTKAAELPLYPSTCDEAKEMYYTMNPDVRNSGVDALLHYLNNGKNEGRPWYGPIQNCQALTAPNYCIVSDFGPCDPLTNTRTRTIIKGKDNCPNLSEKCTPYYCYKGSNNLGQMFY